MASSLGRQEQDDVGRDGLSLCLLLAAVVLIPITVTSVVLTAKIAVPDLNRRTSLGPYDLVQMAIIAVAIVHARPWRRPERPLVPALVALLGAVLTIAWLANPSTHGAELVLRYAAAVAIVYEMRRLAAVNRQRVLATLFVVGVLEAVLAVAQVRHGDLLGIQGLELDHYPLFRFGSQTAGQGGLSHPYHLMCLLAVCAGAGLLAFRRSDPGRRWLWVAGFVTIGAAMGTTHSRASLLGLVPALAVAVWVGRDPAHTTARLTRLAMGAAAVGFAASSVMGASGWTSRADAALDPGAFDSGRIDRMLDAVQLIRDNPIVGVGPGRYVEAIAGAENLEPLPPHNWLLHAAGEAGLGAAGLVLVLSVVLTRRARAGGLEAVLALVLLAPFFVLDVFPYGYPVGILLSALWVGAILTAADDKPPASLDLTTGAQEQVASVPPVHNTSQTDPPSRTGVHG